MFPLQIVRDPEQVEPPNRIDHELSRRERPGLPVAKKDPPLDISRRRFWIALDVLTFAIRTPRMVLRFSVENQPQNEPRESQSPSEQKCPLPPKMYSDPRHDQRSNNCPNVRPGVKDPRCQRPLFLWKPFRNALDACREHSSFAESQGGSGDYKCCEGMRDGMPHRRETPEDHREGIPDSRAQTVYQAAHKNHPKSVGRLKREHEIPVVDLVPSKLMLKRAF